MRQLRLAWYRGPLIAAAAIAVLLVSRHRTLAAATGFQALWPAIALAALPLAAAWAELRWLRRREGFDEKIVQRLMDSHAWLGLCFVELLFPFFAARLGTFLPALGLLLAAADQAWIASAVRYSRDLDPGPDDPARSAGPGPRFLDLFSTRRRIWAAGLLMGLLVPGLSLSGWLDRHKSFTGDEPAYLLIALSLLEDGDLVMNNQYRERQYTRFGTQTYRVFAHPGMDGRLYPHHNAGLPLLLVPAVALGLDHPERLALLVRGFVALLAAWTVAEIALLGALLGRGVSAGLWSAALAAFTVPFAFYSTQVYPEAPAALLAVLAFRQIVEPRGSFAVAGLASGLLVWLHFKFLPLAALLGLFGLLQPLRWHRRCLFAALVAAPALLFFGFVHATYGTWSPDALQLGVQAAAAGPVVRGEMAERLQRSPLNFLGYFLDQRIGLFFYAPAYLLALPGLLHLGRSHRARAVQLLALGLTPLVLYAWIYWSMGGYGPPNRPAVPGIPFLAVLAGIGCASAPGWAARRLRDLLLLPGLLFSAALLLHHDALYHPMSVRSDGARNMLLTYHGPAGFDLTAWLPAYLGDRLNTVPNAVAPLLALLLSVCLLGLFRQKLRPALSIAAEVRLGRAALGLLAAALLALRLAAIARTPAQVERSELPAALVLAGEGWVEPGPSAWVRGRGWLRLLVPSPAGGAVQLGLESLQQNRVAVRSGGQLEAIDLPAGGTARLSLQRPWRLERGGQSYVLLEAACASGVQEPRGARWLGVRLVFSPP